MFNSNDVINIAIRNFNEELYRIVKAIASLENRTIASILEEAVSMWIESRGDYGEVRLWVDLERAYAENMEVLEKNMDRLEKHEEGYALICDVGASRYL